MIACIGLIFVYKHLKKKAIDTIKIVFVHEYIIRNSYSSDDGDIRLIHHEDKVPNFISDNN